MWLVRLYRGSRLKWDLYIISSWGSVCTIILLNATSSIRDCSWSDKNEEFLASAISMHPPLICVCVRPSVFLSFSLAWSQEQHDWLDVGATLASRISERIQTGSQSQQRQTSDKDFSSLAFYISVGRRTRLHWLDHWPLARFVVYGFSKTVPTDESGVLMESFFFRIYSVSVLYRLSQMCCHVLY